MTTKIAVTTMRIEGPAGVRLVAPIADGHWAIQLESGPTAHDPSSASQTEAVAWATETVNKTGTPFPPLRAPHGGSPNERPDALAKTQRPPSKPSMAQVGRRR